MARINSLPVTPAQAKKIVKDLYAMAVRNADTNCLEMPKKFRRGGGYGFFVYEGEKYSAHRFMFIVLNGKIHHRLVVRHTCDNPPCIEPRHLVKGTVKQNIQDKIERDRQPRGEKASNAKLTTAEIVFIRKAITLKISSQRRLAKIFGVCHKHIQRIISAENWQHVS